MKIFQIAVCTIAITMSCGDASSNNVAAKEVCAVTSMDGRASSASCKEDPTVMTDQKKNGTEILMESQQQGEEDVVSESSYQRPAPPVFQPPESFGSDIGEVQLVDRVYSDSIIDRVNEAMNYVKNEVMVDEKYSKVRSICKNKHENCAFWSVLGECDVNPAYMKVNCAPVCGTCEMLHVETRCPMDPNAIDAWYPGDLDKMFQRVATEPEYQQYQPVVVSQPPEGPWMIMFENALSDEEAQALIDLGTAQGYERSADVGKEQEDGTYTKHTNSGRTSTNAWCTGDCYDNPIAQRVMKRIENITGIPETNSENLQLLRYDQTQFYQTHSDYIPFQVNRPTGVRILTFYMYLNDVEQGGGTNFPVLDKTVTPKRGRAVMWPSVLDHDPNKKDSRTNHQALPVIEGVKYGANAWVHQRDFKVNNQNGCT